MKAKNVTPPVKSSFLILSAINACLFSLNFLLRVFDAVFLDFRSSLWTVSAFAMYGIAAILWCAIFIISVR